MTRSGNIIHILLYTIRLSRQRIVDALAARFSAGSLWASRLPEYRPFLHPMLVEISPAVWYCNGVTSPLKHITTGYAVLRKCKEETKC